MSLTKKGSLLPNATLSGRPGVSFGSLLGKGDRQRPAGTIHSTNRYCIIQSNVVGMVWKSCGATAQSTNSHRLSR